MDADSLLTRNLLAFERLAPHLHARLSRVDQTYTELVDGPDIRQPDGRLLYGAPAAVASEVRVREFMLRPATVSMQPPTSPNLDQYAGTAVYRALEQARAAGLTFGTQPTAVNAHHLVVLGVGLGFHLDPLIAAVGCRHLAICEPIIEYLWHSLHVFDWQAFFERHAAIRISWIDAHAPQDIALAVRANIRAAGTPFVDGTTIYTQYRSPTIESAGREIAKDANMLLVGFGFLEDELDMVRNARRNLERYSGPYFWRGCVAFGDRIPPAMVVGSGPSLDNDLQAIRRNAGSAYVISCGTALRSLLMAGIVPDFHMEMENVPAVYDLLGKLATTDERVPAAELPIWVSGHKFSNITLVCSTTVDPRVPALFKKTLLYFRGGIASSPLFAPHPDTDIQGGLPTVANLGLAFAQEIGCRSIYLFGVDFGVRDPKKHHAQDSAYMAGEIESPTTVDRHAAGNFGGVVHTELVWLWARDMAEQLVAGRPHIKHYNCSDGLRMVGAMPLRSESLNLKAIEKSEVLDRFPVYGRQMFDRAWSKSLMANAERLADDLVQVVSPGHKPIDEIMYRLFRKLTPAEPTADIHYFRGTLFLAMASLYFYGRRASSRVRFLGIARHELMTLVLRILSRIREFYGERT